MNETYNWTEIYNRAFELANATTNTWLDIVSWGVERSLNLNKALVAQFEESQREARKYINDLNGKSRESVELVNEVVQNSVQTYSNGISRIRNFGQNVANEVNQKANEEVIAPASPVLS